MCVLDVRKSGFLAHPKAKTKANKKKWTKNIWAIPFWSVLGEYIEQNRGVYYEESDPVGARQLRTKALRRR